VRRWLERRIDAILCVVLVAGAVWIAVRRPFGIEPAPSGSLAGALFGGAAVLLANAINRANQRAQAAEESKQRRVKVERLITVELRNVSRNLIDAIPLKYSSIRSRFIRKCARDIQIRMPPKIMHTTQRMNHGRYS